MTGPERHVLKAIAALTMDRQSSESRAWHSSSGVPVQAVADLSKYPDLEDRRHIVALERKGYVKTWESAAYSCRSRKQVKLTTQGWMEALS